MKKFKNILFVIAALFMAVITLASCGGPAEYVVSYYNGKDLHTTQKVVDGNKATAPAAPTKEYMKFDNWCTDEELSSVYDFNTPVKKDMSLYAKFSKITYTLTFESNGGSKIESKTVEANSTVAELPTPTKDRFTFEGWFTDSELKNKFTSTTKVLANQTLYAKWHEKYFVITFDAENDSRLFTQLVEENTLAVKPFSPEKVGYVFDGWAKQNGELFDFNTPITSNMTLKAKYSLDDKKYCLVSFEANGGSSVPAKLAYKGETISIPLSVKDDYILEGWYTDSALTNKFTESTPVNTDITLYAKWTEARTVTFFRVTFNPDNGESTFTQAVMANTCAIKPQDPEKAGYKFVNWVKEDGSTFNFNEQVSANVTLKADYIKVDETKYVVSFETNGGSTVSSIVVNPNSTILPPLSTKDNYILEGWYIDQKYETKFTKDTVINSDLTLYAKWTSTDVDKYYIVTFDSDNGNQLFTESVLENKTAIKPANPEKSGYRFVNWIKEDGAVFNFNTPITSNIKLTATYLAVDDSKYVVSFEANGGSTVSAMVVNPNSTIGLPLSFKQGYILAGWYTDAAFEHQFTQTTQITSNITLYAKWEELTGDEYFEVTFNPNNGSVLFKETVRPNTQAIMPINPEKLGYAFVNWVKEDGSVFNFNTPINANITLTASYVEVDNTKYVVTFEANGGSTVPAKVVSPKSTISLPLSIKDGYILVGWYTDKTFEHEFTSNTEINNYLTLYAKWEVPAGDTYYDVTFDLDNGATNIVEKVKENGLAIKPATPEKVGYTFVNWLKEDDTVFNFNTPITAKITLKASYVKVDNTKFVVSFEANGGSTISAMVVTPGSTIGLPLSVKDGYILSGWYTSQTFEAEFTKETRINSNITLYAKWDKPEENQYYEVTFDPDNGGATFKEVVAPNSVAIRPMNPEKNGYAFVNWVTEDGTAFNFNTHISANITLTASYVAVDDTKYVVSFESNGGSTVSAMVVTPGSTISLPLSVKEGFVLLGWYTNLEFTEEFNKYSVVQSNMTLYAKWRISTEGYVFTVTFDPNNGDALIVETVEKNKLAIKPEAPTKDGYKFVNWCIDEKPFSFNTPITEDIRLVAKWREDTSDICIVSFVTFGGSEISSIEVKSGDLLTLPTEPYFEGNRFVGWFTDLDCTIPFDKTAPITSDITLFAEWDYIVGETYTVTFIDSDGNPISVMIADNTYVYSQTVEKGADAIPPADPIKEGYRFDGWSTSYKNVQSNLEIKATFVRAYNVYFYDYNRVLLKQELVDFGNSPIAPESPTRYGYRFIGWDVDFNYITQDTIIQATYIKQYEIKFRDYNNEIITWDWYDEGAKIIAPEVPAVTIEDKEFDGWDQEFDTAVKDVTIRMTIRTKIYAVNFYDIDGSILKHDIVYIGENATSPDLTGKIYIDWKSAKKTAYIFDKWDKEFNNVTSSLDVKAVYNKIEEPLIYVETGEISQGQTKVDVSVYLIYSGDFEAVHMNFRYDPNLAVSEDSITLRGQFNRGAQSNLTLDSYNKTFSFNCINTEGFELNGNYAEVMKISVEVDKYFSIGEYNIEVLDGSYLTNNGVVKILPVVINGGVVIA